MQKSVTEIIAEEMMMLSGARAHEGAQTKAPQAAGTSDVPTEEAEAAIDQADQKALDIEPSEIPF